MSQFYKLKLVFYMIKFPRWNFSRSIFPSRKNSSWNCFFTWSNFPDEIFQDQIFQVEKIQVEIGFFQLEFFLLGKFDLEKIQVEKIQVEKIQVEKIQVEKIQDEKKQVQIFPRSKIPVQIC